MLAFQRRDLLPEGQRSGAISLRLRKRKRSAAKDLDFTSTRAAVS